MKAAPIQFSRLFVRRPRGESKYEGTFVPIGSPVWAVWDQASDRVWPLAIVVRLEGASS